MEKKETDSALRQYQLAAGLMPPDSLYSASRLSLLQLAGTDYKSRSLYKQAVPFYLEAGQIINKLYGADSDSAAMNAYTLGMLHYQLKNYRQAEENYMLAGDVFKKRHTETSKEYAAMCNALGILYNDSGQFTLAEAIHLKAKDIREKIFGKESSDYARSCNNLAALYWNLGKLELAEPLAKEARDIRGRLKSVPRSVYAISCVNLANIYRDMGKYDQALSLYAEAKSEREKFFTKQHEEYAQTCDILADLYYYKKNYTEAENLYLEAKKIRENMRTTDSYFYGQSCANLSALYRETGALDTAETLALKANQIWSKLGMLAEADMAINNNNLGLLYMFKGDFPKAESYLSAARVTWKKKLGEAHPFLIDNTLNLARVFWNKNEPVRSAEFYNEAFDRQKKQLGRMFGFTSEKEKELYLEHVTGNEDEYQSFFYSYASVPNNGQPYNISLQRRNQLLSSSRHIRDALEHSGDALTISQFRDWIELRKQLAQLYAKGDKAPQGEMESVASQSDSLEKILARKIPALESAGQNNQNWKRVQANLGATDAAIEFIEFRYMDKTRQTDSVMYMAEVLRKGDKEPVHVFLFEKKRLDSLLSRMKYGSVSINKCYLGKMTTGPMSKTNVYDLVWKPIEPFLKGIKNIYFAPAGLLHRVSFAAMPVDDRQSLLDRYTLIQCSSTAQLPDQAGIRIREDDKISLYGGINYSTNPTLNTNAFAKRGLVSGRKRSGLTYLPGTKSEVDNIAVLAGDRAYRVSKKTGWGADENSFKELSGTQAPALIHVATHGFFFTADTTRRLPESGDSVSVFRYSSEPLLRTGLLFAGSNDAWNGRIAEGQSDDGILTAYEVSNMELSGTALVTLSACETGLGDIKGSEGVYGLQRAFKIAGARQLIMSLWKVPDQETAEFMSEFYREVFAGKDISGAFHETQIRMKNKYAKEPYKWAAWVLIN